MNKSTPKTGFKGLKSHWKSDLRAGFSVSLIALPLSLGIAIASGVPPIAGLITAIVGGLLVSRIGGAYMTISGPAAGLIVITLAATQNLGGAGASSGFAGYEHALGAFLIGGIIVAILGLLKVGKFGDFFPPTVVHGMLAAIGVIIMIKQIYVALGIEAEQSSIIEQLLQLPLKISETHTEIALISGISLAVLILHPKLKHKWIQLIPAPMFVLIVTIPLVSYFDLEARYLVDLPSNVLDGIRWPSFQKINENAFWMAVVGVALVSGIESLLSTIAIDTQDPYERKSNLNKDLFGVGVGSTLASALGGLPMISEIVRSSANINNGAKTSWSNFFHGALLLVYLVAGSFIIEMIPLAALATMLVFTGYKLAAPQHFKAVYKIGKAHLAIFVFTLVMVLITDLLIGIAAGILLKLSIHLIYGAKLSNLFVAKLRMPESNICILKVEGVLIFTNYLSFKSQIKKIARQHPNLKIDVSKVKLIDHTFQLHFGSLVNDLVSQGYSISLINKDCLKPVSRHRLSAKLGGS